LSAGNSRLFSVSFPFFDRHQRRNEKKKKEVEVVAGLSVYGRIGSLRSQPGRHLDYGVW
jgi:hypothetical protein